MQIMGIQFLGHSDKSFVKLFLPIKMYVSPEWRALKSVLLKKPLRQWLGFYWNGPFGSAADRIDVTVIYHIPWQLRIDCCSREADIHKFQSNKKPIVLEGVQKHVFLKICSI